MKPEVLSGCAVRAQIQRERLAIQIPALSIVTTGDGHQFYAVPIGTHWIIAKPKWLLQLQEWWRS